LTDTLILRKTLSLAGFNRIDRLFGIGLLFGASLHITAMLLSAF